MDLNLYSSIIRSVKIGGSLIAKCGLQMWIVKFPVKSGNSEKCIVSLIFFHFVLEMSKKYAQLGARLFIGFE